MRITRRTLGLGMTKKPRIGVSGCGGGNPRVSKKQPIVSQTNTATVMSNPIWFKNKALAKSLFKQMDRAVSNHGEIHTAKAKP